VYTYGMKWRLFIAVCVLTLLSPVLTAFAQQPYTRYCHDPAKDFFKGSIAYGDDNKPWIEVKVDPDFETKFKAERHITGDLLLTPVYDLVVRIKPEFKYYCIPGWVEGKEVAEADLPKTIEVSGYVTVGTKDNVVVGPGTFTRTEKQDEKKRFIYEWKIKGWPSGIATRERFSRLISGVVANEPIFISLEIVKSSGAVARERSDISFDLCVPISGPGRHRVVGLYDIGSDADTAVSYFDDIRKTGFSVIEPYRSHQSYFSYFVDLKRVSGNASNEVGPRIIAAIQKAGLSKATPKIQGNIIAPYFRGSSCSDGTFLLRTKGDERVLYSLPSVGLVGIATYESTVARGALIDSGNHQRTEKHGISNIGLISVHEFSHAFAGLDDEYVTHNDAPSEYGLLLRNCSKTPLVDFSYEGKRYGGADYEGCTFFTSHYRSSESSLMGNSALEFNVVSCGWILAAIKGGDAKSHFPECAKMGGVIKDGVQASAFYPLFALLERAFAYPQEQKQTAAVGASGISGRKEYIIVENFDPNNRWGRIVEVVPDTNSPSTSTTVPSANASDELVQTENIFDTVSIDVKVNGSDGPVEVQKGGRIVVSWISEGASRCRAMWSKNDIAKSGTIAGRLSKTGSFSIRAACIDAEGNRADDSVVVNVRDLSDLN